jgi:hypothetical protein
MSFLAGAPCDEVENEITELLKFDDPPIWSVGKFRGVASKIAATEPSPEDFMAKDEEVRSSVLQLLGEGRQQLLQPVLRGECAPTV